MEKVSSAVEMVLPLGVFITTMPRWVAASTSTLSTPTPARPTTFNCGAESMIFLVIFVSDRTTSALASLMTGNNSASGSRLSSTCTLNSARCWNIAMPLGEIGSQITIFIAKTEWQCRQSDAAGQMRMRVGGAPGTARPTQVELALNFGAGSAEIKEGRLIRGGGN